MNWFCERKPLFLLFFLGLAVAFSATGCGGGGGDDDGDRGPPVIGPNLNGQNWTGFYFNGDSGFMENLTASVTHTSNQVVIVTSKTAPPAQQFTGTINAAGKMDLTDAWDGEQWTTFFGPASNRFIKVADFARPPMDQSIEDEINVPFKILELSR